MKNDDLIKSLKEIKAMGMKVYKTVGGGIIAMKSDCFLASGTLEEATDEYVLNWLARNKKFEDKLTEKIRFQDAELN